VVAAIELGIKGVVPGNILIFMPLIESSGERYFEIECVFLSLVQRPFIDWI